MALHQQSQDLNPSEYLASFEEENFQTTSQDMLWDALKASWNFVFCVVEGKKNSYVRCEF